MNNKRWVGRVILLALGSLALVSPTYASQHHQQTKAAAQTHQKVTYQTDGTPVATGAPRRLSALAMGGSAWTAYHEMRGKRHRQQIANKQ
jgi:hypothetical protein